MADLKNLKKPKKKNTKRKQGHKLVWLTLLIIAIPCAFVGYVIATSAVGQDKPVEGNRFSSKDLNPEITSDNINAVQSAVASIDGVQNVEVTLKSATLRVTMDMADDASQDVIQAAADQGYDAVVNILPAETYFTNTEDGKNYDLEVGAYNYIPDDTNADGYVYIKITKTGNGNRTSDVETTPKNQDVVNAITR